MGGSWQRLWLASSVTHLILHLAANYVAKAKVQFLFNGVHHSGHVFGLCRRFAAGLGHLQSHAKLDARGCRLAWKWFRGITFFFCLLIGFSPVLGLSQISRIRSPIS